MNKLILPGFNEVSWLTRCIPHQEALSECMTMANCDLQVFFLDYPEGTIKTPHSHEEIRLVFVRCGKMTMTVGDETSELEAGDIIVMLPDILHSFIVSGEDPLRLAECIIDPVKQDE